MIHLRGLTRRSFAQTSLLAALAAGACGRAGGPDALLRVGLAGAPDSLDPMRAEFAAAAILLNQIHAPLDSYRPGWGLAESWEADPTQTQWRATLREGLAWSDGAPLTAEDVVWSIRHAAGPRTAYPGLGDLLAITGAASASLGMAPAEEIGVGAPDARTVVFTLTEPLGVFPETMREFYPVPRHAIEAHGEDWTRPDTIVCSGPYVPETVSQLDITLSRNPRHFRAADIAIPAIAVSAVDDEGARVRLFRAGDLDIAQDPPAAQIDSFSGSLAEAAHTWPAPRLTYLKVNHAHEALADARVRRALTLAADRAFMAGTLMRGYASPAPTVIPDSPNADARPLEARRAEAASLIRDAGAEGLSLELLHSGGPRETLAIALADDWARIGVEARISRTEATGLYAAVDEGRFDLAMAGFDRGLKDAPWRYLEPFAPGGFAANFGWDSPALADALTGIRAEPDAARRAGLAHEAERLILEPAALIPLLHEDAAWLVDPGIADRAGNGPPLFWADLALG